MGEKDGVLGVARGAVAAAGELARGGGAEEEQLDLVGMLPPRREAEDAGLVRDHVLANARARGVGRPLGAPNLATRQVKEFIVKVFGDPLIESARWLLHTPATLARALDCTVAEAFDRQQRIREALAPYIHAKVAPVGEDGQPVPFFQLIMGSPGGPGAVARAPWLDDPEVRQALEHEDQRNQRVSDDAPAKSHEKSRTDTPSD